MRDTQYRKFRSRVTSSGDPVVTALATVMVSTAGDFTVSLHSGCRGLNDTVSFTQRDSNTRTGSNSSALETIKSGRSAVSVFLENILPGVELYDRKPRRGEIQDQER